MAPGPIRSGGMTASPLANDAEDAPALIGLTSGTTGRPVGIILDHERALLRFTFRSRAAISAPVMLNPLPLSFSASRSHTFAALAEGDGGLFLSAAVLRAGTGRGCLGRRRRRRSARFRPSCAVGSIWRGGAHAPLFDTLDALYCFGAPMLAAEKLEAKARLSSNFVQEYGASFCGRITALRGADLDAKPERSAAR